MYLILVCLVVIALTINFYLKRKKQTVEARPSSRQPQFDHEKAALILGKYVIIGITFNDHNDKFLRLEQYHGKVIEVDEKKGISIELKGVHEGEVYNLPPEPQTFSRAAPGTYTLKSTSEEIQNPDFQTTWIMTDSHPENRPRKNGSSNT